MKCENCGSKLDMELEETRDGKVFECLDCGFTVAEAQSSDGRHFHAGPAVRAEVLRRKIARLTDDGKEIPQETQDMYDAAVAERDFVEPELEGEPEELEGVGVKS